MQHLKSWKTFYFNHFSLLCALNQFCHGRMERAKEASGLFGLNLFLLKLKTENTITK